VIVALGALLAGAFFLGYWTLGNGFAHGLTWGALALAGVVMLLGGAAILAWRGRRRSWGGWARSGSRMVMAFTVTCLGLSAGATLGRLDLVPACRVPVEIPVLASSENVAAVHAAASLFEQAEPTFLGQSCYAADLTVSAARSDGDAEADLESGWGPSALSADGPRPDIWLPSSSEEVTNVISAHRGPATPGMQIAGSTGSSPLVLAVPTARADSIPATDRAGNWGTLYTALQQHGISLSVPNPGQSATGLLGIAGIYRDLTSTGQRQIAASGSFPSDSGIALCAAAQAAEQGHAVSSAYLVSVAAMTQYRLGQLNEGACPALSAPFPSLTALSPSDAASLDFPLVSLSWGGNSAAARLAQGYALDFYHWLGSTAGQGVLNAYGLGPPQPWPALPGALPSRSQLSSALQLFTRKAPPAQVLVAIDDSGPMEPYLQQISSAVSQVLGPGPTASLGARDSVGIWAFPGAGSSTFQALVPLDSGATAQRDAVAARTSTLSAHAHSAEFDLITKAAAALYSPLAKAQGATSSVILLTDGDSYRGGQDPAGNTLVSVGDLLKPIGAAQPIARVFVIAFGDAGCAQAPPGSPRDTLAALATTNGGTCVNANDLGQQLGQMVSQFSAGR
jgi:hypothetical protein